MRSERFLRPTTEEMALATHRLALADYPWSYQLPDTASPTTLNTRGELSDEHRWQRALRAPIDFPTTTRLDTDGVRRVKHVNYA
jgi:hypothetical protein